MVRMVSSLLLALVLLGIPRVARSCSLDTAVAATVRLPANAGPPGSEWAGSLQGVVRIQRTSDAAW